MSISINFDNIVRISYLDKKGMEDAIDLQLGYRYVHYVEDEREEGDGNPIGKVYLLGYSKKDGSRTCFEVSDYPLFLWQRTDISDDKNEWKDAYGKAIVKKEFPSEHDRHKYVRTLKGTPSYVSNQIVCCDRPHEQFMKEVFLPVAISADGNEGPLRTFYLDIETEISGSFMPPHISANRINMITVLDSETKTFHTWSLQKVKVLQDTAGEGFKYVAHDDFQDQEAVMLRDFLNFWERNYPDVVCGWNSYEFDMPYIICRCEKVLGKVATRRFSPFNEYTIRHKPVEPFERDPDTGRLKELEEIQNVVLPGISQLDEMKLYRDKFQVKAALDGGYGLGNVGKAEDLGGKVSYETTLLDLYLHDWQKFYEYNVRDVDLLYAIERKCKLIPLARKLVGFGFCNYEDIYQTTSYLINTLALYTLKNRDHVVFNTYANHFAEKRPYEGAFVFKPVTNRYSGGVACVDFNSLYPSCIRAMNLSTETYVGRLIWPDGEAQWDTWQKIGGVDGLKDEYQYEFLMDRTDTPAPGESVQLTKVQIKKLLDEKCLICGPNLTFFIKHEVKKGIVAQWAGDFFAWRKKVKKQAGEAARKSHKEKDPQKKFELETLAEVLGNLQQAIKILLNSCYGLFGTSTCCLYNPSIAQSITRLGRFCNLNGSRFYGNWLKDKYGVPDDHIGTIGGDTDSVPKFTKLRVKYQVNESLAIDNIAIGELYDKYLNKGLPITTTPSGHELLSPDDGLQVLSNGDSYKKVKFLSRHKTGKPLVEITCSNGNSITVTTDHICMSYNDDHMLENTAAKDLKVGSFIKYHEEGKGEMYGSITFIKELGSTEEYVYDLEVEDESHVYYANDILIHNSCFLNLQAITDDLSKTYGISPDLNKWTDEQKLKLWDMMSKFVDETLIPQVQGLVAKMCHTSNAEVLRYGLEYIGSGGIYESPKHYGVHKIIDEGPELVDKFKFTGIAIKKAEVPAEIKEFLRNIYCTAIIDPAFDDMAMQQSLTNAYSVVKGMTANQLGRWQGYGTERKMGEGFLNAEKGMTGISKAVGYYNQIIKDMGIGKKYGSIEVGDKVQMVYVRPENKYGVNVMAFKPRQWPEEFNAVFEVDKPKMFDRLVMSSLKNFFEALHFTHSKEYDPAAVADLAYSVDDL